MRNDCNITVEAIIAEINDEARRDDPVKTAAFASKQGNNNGNNSQQTGGRKDNKNSRRSGRNKDKGAAQTLAQNDSKLKLLVGYCDYCKYDYFSFSANCYRKFPYLAPPR
jgi:hypothetical protein